MDVMHGCLEKPEMGACNVRVSAISQLTNRIKNHTFCFGLLLPRTLTRRLEQTHTL